MNQRILSDVLIRNAKRTPHKAGLVFQGRTFSFQEINERVNRLTQALRSLEVRRHSRVAILADNCPEYVEALFATSKLGAILVPLNTRLHKDELLYVINSSEPVVVILEIDYSNLLESILPQCHSAPNTIVIGGSKEQHSYEGLISRYPANESQEKIDENDLACLAYTGGTTSEPKGSELTHRSMIGSALNAVFGCDIRTKDIALATTPLFHAAGLWPLLAHFYIGAGAVLLPLKGGFDPDLILTAIEKERITFINSVPTIVSRLADQATRKKYDLSSLRWLGYGGSPMPSSILEKSLSIFGRKLGQVYGLTEICGPATVLLPEDHVLTGTEKQTAKLRSCGKEIHDIEVKLFDKDDKEVATGDVGEIVIKSEAVMRGYWKMQEATINTIRSGYFHSGDLAQKDEDGYIYIVDRLKDMIISGGENIYPREVEEVLAVHPAVSEVAVIGVPDEEWGESVKAVIVLQDGKSATEESIIKFCKERIASYKKPKSVSFVTELPKNARGKILKKELRKRFV